MKTISGKKVLVIAGDIGGWNAIAPVVEKLNQEGAQILIVLVGDSKKAHANKNLTVNLSSKVDVAFVPDLVLIAASQSHEGTETTAEVLREVSPKTPVLVVEDMYGSSIPIFTRLNEMFFTARVCVIDIFAEQMLEKHIRSANIIVTGGPQFDRIAEMKNSWTDRRKAIRQILHVPDSGKLFLIAGQRNGTAEAIMLLVGLMEPADDWILVRQHPGATDLDKRLTATVLKSFSIPLIFPQERIPADFKSTEDFLPAADFVLSGYSTTLRYAILCGMPGVVFLGTPSFKWDMWDEKKITMAPEAMMGAGWYVRTQEDMRHVMNELEKGDKSEELGVIKHNQSLLAQHADGHSADRVLEQVLSMM